MRQQQFQQQHQQTWDRLNKILNGLDALKKSQRPTAGTLLSLPDLYVELCQHLALAQSRGYSPGLIEQLHTLALRAHDHLYRRKFQLGGKIVQFFTVDFPQTLRAQWLLFLLACILFFGSMLVLAMLCYFQPELIYSLMDESQVASMEYMYNPDQNHLIGRTQAHEASSRVLMFAYYIRNNTGIGFQTFAGGILAGIGTIFYLLYNGLILGAVSGYLTQLGSAVPFWSFVAGHSAFELTAIAISGCAGLMLGKAILLPNNLSRRDALRLQAQPAVVLMCGAALLFLAAAAVEGFWSPISSIPPVVKYAVGIVLWLLLIAYLLFAGGNQHEH